MKNATVAITHKLPTETSFGMDVETGEQVFIPAHIVIKSKVDIGDVIECVLLPNAGDKSGTTPYQVFKLADPTPQAVEPFKLVEPIAANNDEIDEAIIDWLALNFFAKTSEVFEALPDLNTTEKQIGNRLLALFNAGVIAKADVFAAGGQSRASFCLWATDADSFTE